MSLFFLGIYENYWVFCRGRQYCLDLIVFSDIHEIFKEIPKFASSLRFIEAKSSKPSTQKWNRVVSAWEFTLYKVYESIPVLSMHNFPYPNSDSSLFWNFLQGMHRNLTFFVTITKLVVIKYFIGDIFEDKEGCLIELSFFGKILLLLFFGEQIVKLWLHFQIGQFWDRMGEFAELRLHDADTPEIESTQWAFLGDSTSLLDKSV